MSRIEKQRTTSYANDLQVVRVITHVTCPECGVPYGLAEEFRAAREKDHRNWFCPNGHSLWFSDQDERAEAVRLKDQLDRQRVRETALRDQLDSTERSRRAYKGKVTQIKRRVGRGVCPCCNRTFADLGRHMEGQHPEYADGGSE